MGPARAAILRNVLIANVRQEIGPVDVVPDPSFGDVICWHQGLSDMRLEIFRKRETARTVGVR